MRSNWSLKQNIIFSDPNGLSDSLTAIYRQAKMREANKGDLSVSASQNQVEVTFGKKQIQFQFCPILDRVMTKANCNLDIVVNDTGDNGRIGSKYVKFDKNVSFLNKIF